jgi:hypothetical protein
MLALTLKPRQRIVLDDPGGDVLVLTDDAGRLTLALPKLGPGDTLTLDRGGRTVVIAGGKRRASRLHPLRFAVPPECQVALTGPAEGVTP